MRAVTATGETLAQRLNKTIAAMDALTRGVEELRADVRGAMGSELRQIQTRLQNLERNVERFMRSGTEPEGSVAEVSIERSFSPAGDGAATLAALFEQVRENQDEIQQRLGQIRQAMESRSEDRGAELEVVLSQLEKTVRAASQELNRTR